MNTNGATPPVNEQANKPFYFNSSAHLMRIGREKATNLEEFLQGLRTCPEESIFQHMFQTLEEHHFIREGFSNDFAQWVFEECNEPALAERLSGVDIREYTSVEALRKVLVVIVEQHVKLDSLSQQRSAHEPFYFCSSEKVIIPTSFSAHDLIGFAEALHKVSIHTIHHHFIDARLRLKLVSNDFSVWVQEEMELPALARKLDRIDIYTATLEDVRNRIIHAVEETCARRVV